VRHSACTAALSHLTRCSYVDQRQPHGQTSKKRQAIKDRQGAATKRPMQPRQGPESTNSETFGTPMQVGCVTPSAASSRCNTCCSTFWGKCRERRGRRR
jgi:hypothetical protein